MMPTLWVSCTALVLVAVFVPLLAVAVALPYVDDVRLWVDWYTPLYAGIPLLPSRLLCEFVYPFHLVCFPVSAHTPPCVDSCYVLSRLGRLLCRLVRYLVASYFSTAALSWVDSCSLVSTHALLCRLMPSSVSSCALGSTRALSVVVLCTNCSRLVHSL